MKKALIDTKWFHGAVSFEQTDDGIRPYRLPYNQLKMFHPDLVSLAKHSTGVRVSFETDSKQVQFMVLAAEQTRKFDLVIEGELYNTALLPEGKTEVFFNLPDGMKKVEIYLHHAAPVTVQALLVEDEASIRPADRNQPRWITYGSSISHCGAAASPAQTWPAIVARTKGWDLTCLGFSGQCHLEPMVARMIRDLPADVISLCLGINVYGRGSLNQRSFRSAVIGMIAIIREKHPHTPLVLISPIYSPQRESIASNAGLTLMQMREEIQEAFAIITSYGDTNLHYIHGLDVFGSAYSEYLPDDLHPNAEGYKLMAKHFLQHPIFANL